MMKRWVVTALIVVLAGTAQALKVEIKRDRDFMIVTQRDGVTLIGSFAVRKLHVSSVALEKAGTGYKIVLVTSVELGGETGLTLKTYETAVGPERDMQEAFEEIMQVLTQG
jgi:hypothetical protein